MKNVVIKMSDFGSHLSCRLYAREKMTSLKSTIESANYIVIDFNGVQQVSMSFTTEIFDSLSAITKNIDTINENEYVKLIVDFAKSNIVAKPILTKNIFFTPKSLNVYKLEKVCKHLKN